MLSEAVKQSISESVLCWLATCNEKGEPNCSPKEVFTFNGHSELVIANIASPGSVTNIRSNPNVCVSFVHVFKQKGFKVKGTARYIANDSPEFDIYFPLVEGMVGNTFKVQGFIIVAVISVSAILAPAYYMVKGTTEETQVASAKKTYGV